MYQRLPAASRHLLLLTTMHAVLSFVYYSEILSGQIPDIVHNRANQTDTQMQFEAHQDMHAQK